MPRSLRSDATSLPPRTASMPSSVLGRSRASAIAATVVPGPSRIRASGSMRSTKEAAISRLASSVSGPSCDACLARLAQRLDRGHQHDSRSGGPPDGRRGRRPRRCRGPRLLEMQGLPPARPCIRKRRPSPRRHEGSGRRHCCRPSRRRGRRRRAGPCPQRRGVARGAVTADKDKQIRAGIGHHSRDAAGVLGRSSGHGREGAYHSEGRQVITDRATLPLGRARRATVCRRERQARRGKHARGRARRAWRPAHAPVPRRRRRCL